VDKPQGWTSHDVVGKLRGLFHVKRIGHGGTLDPMATGVLPVFVGRATRAVEFCENAQKEYVAGLELGLITDTQDTTGTILERREANVSLSELQAVCREFQGVQQQLPPMYSAVKVGGKKLYELARKGVEVERKPREITIFKLEPSEMERGFQLDVICSKGTYIRTLCSDIGEKLGCGGAMSALRRTRAGSFTLSDAVTMDELIAAGENGTIERLLRPVDSLFAQYPEIYVNPTQERKCRCGNDFPTRAEDGQYRVYSEAGEFLMVGRAESGVMKTVKSFFEV
jgi:tRNA pseudouridine55 synthase